MKLSSSIWPFSLSRNVTLSERKELRSLWERRVAWQIEEPELDYRVKLCIPLIKLLWVRNLVETSCFPHWLLQLLHLVHGERAGNSAYLEPTEGESLLISSCFCIFPLPPLLPEIELYTNMKKISSGAPAARTAANLSIITILKRSTCIHTYIDEHLGDLHACIQNQGCIRRPRTQMFSLVLKQKLKLYDSFAPNFNYVFFPQKKDQCLFLRN